MINWVPTLSHKRLLWLLDYNAATGIFRWRIGTRPIPAGTEAGFCRADGRRVICLDNQEYQAGRLAWFYVHDEWPEGDIDHRDYDPGNNRIGNLRPANSSQNGANRDAPRNNTSGFKGVSREGAGWKAQIKVRGRLMWLGSFSTPRQAADAYDVAAIAHFGEFARTNTQAVPV